MNQILALLCSLIFNFVYMSSEKLSVENNEIMSKDTCNGETFQPSCSNPREALLMTSGIYGRMEIGKCISKKEVSGVLGQDPTYYGCSSDVLNILHDKCSLKQSCDIKIPDIEMDKTEPCFPGLNRYLHSEYKCITVIDQESNCHVQVGSNPKYLTMIKMFNTSICGTERNPWTIEAMRGEKIKFNLRNLKRSGFKFSMTCDEEFGFISEKSHGIHKNVSLCSNGLVTSSDRNNAVEENGEEKDAYVSAGSVVEVFFRTTFMMSHANNKRPVMVLLKFEADGCSDIIPPEDAWLKRTNDDVVIGCYSSKQNWYLRCENRKWSGSIGNCSSGKDAATFDDISISNNEPLERINEEQQIILFVAICALGIVICLVIICIGAICIKRYNWKTGANSIYNKQPTYYQEGHYSTNHQTLINNQQKYFSNQQPTIDNIGNDQFQNKSEENKYFVLETDTLR